MDQYYGGSRYNGSYHANRSRSCPENGNARNCSVERSYSADRRSSDCDNKFHLHEVQGSVRVVGNECEGHNHRFAAVSCEPLEMRDGNHCHVVTFRTDTYNGHYHEFTGRTTGEFEICEGHVHYLEGKTSQQAGHCHDFKVITHIEDPNEG